MSITEIKGSKYMKKFATLFSIILFTFVTGCSLSETQTTTTITTTETPLDLETYHEIYTVTDLQNMEVTKSYRLMADIDLTDVAWVPIGDYINPFLGNFDGNDHTISNLTISHKNDYFNGLFGVVQGDVFDLTIEGASITYTSDYITYVGILAGMSIGNIENVNVSGTIDVENTKGNLFAGLLVGFANVEISPSMVAEDFVKSQLVHNVAQGTLIVDTKNFLYAGGLVGKAHNVDLIGNQVQASIDARNQVYRAYVGGLIGHHYGGILIGYEEFVETTDVYVKENIVSAVIDAVSIGTNLSVGGLIGYAHYSVIEDNFVIGDYTIASDQTDFGGALGEGWTVTMKDIVVLSTLTMNEFEEEGTHLSAIIGFANEETHFENSYYQMTSSETVELQDSILAINTSLINQDWYQTTFDLEPLPSISTFISWIEE